MRWLVRPFFANDELDSIMVVEVEGGQITSAHGITTEAAPEVYGLRQYCGGGIVEPEEWQPIPYDVFNSLGGNTNGTPIRLVENGYIGRRLSWRQIIKLPDGYCSYCVQEHNLYPRPLVGTDKKLYCHRCLRPFEPVLSKR